MYKLGIPAGFVFAEDYEWYSPLKMASMFGKTPVTKEELHEITKSKSNIP